MTTQQQNGTTAVATKPAQELVPIDQVAIIRSKATGDVRMMKSTVVLSVKAGTLVMIPGMGRKVNNEWLNTYLVSADGYKLQAQASGLEVVNAPTVIVDGVEQKNPYVERDPKTGRPRMVHCRAMCYGYTKYGKPVRSDRTAVLDLDLYRLTDMMAKAKRTETADAFKILPADYDRPGKEWARYPIDDAVTMWVNTTASEFLKWQAESINRNKKAVELCQSFAQRNAIHHHPSIAVHKTDGIASIPVQCYCWIPERGSSRWDGTRYDVMVKSLTTGGAEYTEARQDDEVQVTSGVDAIHEEDPEIIDAEAREMAHETDAPTGEDDEQRQTPQQKKQATVIAQIKTMASAVKPSEMAGICDMAGIDLAGGEAWEMADYEKQLKLHEGLSAHLSESPANARNKRAGAK